MSKPTTEQLKIIERIEEFVEAGKVANTIVLENSEIENSRDKILQETTNCAAIATLDVILCFLNKLKENINGKLTLDEMMKSSRQQNKPQNNDNYFKLPPLGDF